MKEIFQTIREFKYRYWGHKCYLADVKFLEDNTILLIVIIQGIKKQITQYSPNEIIKNDELLACFSSCDARTITYLSFYNYRENEAHDFYIEKQFFCSGETFLQLRKIENNEVLPPISAKVLYQKYDLLIKLSRKDMINVVSTAVQEQTILDLNSIN